MRTTKPPQGITWLHLAVTVVGLAGTLGGYVWSAANQVTSLKFEVEALKRESSDMKTAIKVLDQKRELMAGNIITIAGRIGTRASSARAIAPAVVDYDEPTMSTSSDNSDGIVLRGASPAKKK